MGKKLKGLIELIKTSTKAQIISGAVAVAVVGTVGVGGYAIYNNSQNGNANSNTQTSVTKPQKVTNKELLKMLETKKSEADKLLNNADLDNINAMIEELEMKINPDFIT